MRLATFLAPGDSSPRFGVVVDRERLVGFDRLQELAGRTHAELRDVYAYLAALPESEEMARALCEWAREHPEALAGQTHDPAAARLLPAVPRPPALLDFGLTPRHLKNSAATLLRYEYGVVAGSVAAIFVKARIERMRTSPVLLYYKGNHCEVIGDGEATSWPAYSSYLDIEPELALVVGAGARPIAGYLVFNDFSARDIQLPEMMGSGPARSKDFARSNGLGPYLVTPDEVPDPRALEVRARVMDASGALRFDWRGTTAEYSHAPEQALEFLRTVFAPQPGTVIGLGTVPDCTGLDRNQWICPGDRVEISIERLGALRQRIPDRIPRLAPTRWPARPELLPFMRD